MKSKPPSILGVGSAVVSEMEDTVQVVFIACNLVCADLHNFKWKGNLLIWQQTTMKLIQHSPFMTMWNAIMIRETNGDFHRTEGSRC